MWARFTERARRAVQFAQEEAVRFGLDRVDAEHLLLGLVRENDTAAARVLIAIGVSPGRVRAETERLAGAGRPAPPAQPGATAPSMQLTPRSKRVIDLAYDEMQQQGVSYLGSEHLLLGLIRDELGHSSEILRRQGADLERARREARILSDASAAAKGPTSAQMPDPAGLPPQPGDLGTLLKPHGDGLVEVVLGEASLAAHREAWRTRDHHAWRALFEGGGVLLVPSGTPVKFLGAGAAEGYLSVRLLGGAHEGTPGYVRPEDFRRVGPDDRPFPPVTGADAQGVGAAVGGAAAAVTAGLPKAEAPVASPEGPQEAEGVLLRAAEGGGYVQLHRPLNVLSPVRVSPLQFSTFRLQGGEAILCHVEPPTPPEKLWRVGRILRIDGRPAPEPPRFTGPPQGLEEGPKAGEEDAR